MRERYRVIASVLVIVVIVAIAAVRIASAHAELESTIPEPDSTWREAPEEVSIRFSEELDPDGSSLRVLGPDQQVVAESDSSVDLNDPDRTLMRVPLPGGLVPGTYTVEWVTASTEDDHTEEGSFSFTIDPNAEEIETPVVVAPDATLAPIPVGEVDDDSGSNRGAIILGVAVVLIALAVVASIGRRRWWR